MAARGRAAPPPNSVPGGGGEPGLADPCGRLTVEERLEAARREEESLEAKEAARRRGGAYAVEINVERGLASPVLGGGGKVVLCLI